MDMQELLEATKIASESETDSALARTLKTTSASVSNWRTLKNYPNTVTCAKIAEITGVPLARVLGIVGEARAISREEKAVWRRLASAAAVLLFALPMTGHTAPYGMAESKPDICIMRNTI